METINHYIGGRVVEGTSGRHGEVYNPAVGELVRRVAFADEGELDAAVSAASEAFPAWSATPPLRRARVLFRLKGVIEQHLDELAAVVTEEHGKTLDDAKGSITRGLEVVEFACGIPHLLKGEFSEDVGTGVDSYSVRQPLGVVAGITPFNFPAMIPMWKFAPAIACGNAFILKPSERDPSVPLRLAELMIEAGLPPGILNVVNGDKEAVDAILDDPDIQAVGFVGSTLIAEYVYRRATASGKRAQCFGGAKNHMIVMPDADRDATIDGVLGSAFGNAGQRCLAGSVAIAVGEAANWFVPQIVEAARGLEVGPGGDPRSSMGPLIDEASRERVLRSIEAGAREGAAVLLDGRTARVPPRGWFLGPTVLDHVRPGMRVAEEEIFGPVLSIMREATLDAAVATLNRSAYGNMAVIFTASGRDARRFQQHARAGMLGVNVGVPAPMAVFPFSGWKDSFFGTLHANGEDAVRFYTEVRVTVTRWL